MIFIGEQMIVYLQSSLTFPNVKVKDFYSVSTVTPPLVTLDERPGAPLLLPDGQPRLVQNTYQVEVYTKPVSIDGTVYGKMDAARKLMAETAAFLNDKYGLTQSGDAIFNTYANDPNVGRGVARFRGVIDTKTEIIYRSV